MTVTLDEIVQFFYGSGEVVLVWHGAQEELIGLAENTFPGKPFCLVKQWIIADLQLTQAEQGRLASMGLLPKAVYSHEVVLDSRGRFSPGHWVRTNFGISHYQPQRYPKYN